MFEPLILNEKLLGHIFRDRHNTLFFGNRLASTETLASLFPQWKFLGLKQIHSTQWVGAQEYETPPTADAHFTQSHGLALIIRTADCIPILLSHPSYVAAIHAGWRGVAQGIFDHFPSDLPKKNCRAYIGPHIQASSFEVGINVLNEIVTAAKKWPVKESEYVLPHPDPQKAFVNLSRLVSAALESLGVEILHCSSINTFSDTQFFSFRRDREEAGRQLSWIVQH